MFVYTTTSLRFNYTDIILYLLLFIYLPIKFTLHLYLFTFVFSLIRIDTDFVRFINASLFILDFMLLHFFTDFTCFDTF